VTRIEHSAEEADRLFKGFIGIYWLLTLALLVAAIWVRPLALVAAVFSIVLIVWRRRIERAMPKQPWVLDVEDDRITLDRNGDVVTVTRGDPRAVDVVREVRGVPGARAALEEHRWAH